METDILGGVQMGYRTILVLTGTTKVGLLANYAKLRMNGDNIAMHTRESNLLLATTVNATPNAFSDSQYHTHVSPMFEQTFSAEAPLFRYVPVLRRFSVFEKARFRTGCTCASRSKRKSPKRASCNSGA